MPALSRGTKILALTSIGVFLVSLDVSVLNVAFGDMLRDFGTDRRRELTWIFSGYNIAYAAGLLTAGRLADVLGRKRIFLWGLGVFAVGSFMCGVAPNPEFLIAARVVQAIGGAMLTPASLALVLPEFPIERRSAAIGIWGAIGGIAA
ncbi:MAG: MFS transporter, partial [Ilumatobacteraceae bacterium]